ncbi:MAG TPA: hypothetical protein VLG36_03470 [Candidatus Chromulinivoraceae bacterium]|nr:hypothetical protein [Candidatus Chromulinivoraceae bacterium]
MNLIDDVKRHVMRNYGEHTAIGVQRILGDKYPLEIIREAFRQLKDDPSSGTVSSSSDSRIWSPGSGSRR